MRAPDSTRYRVVVTLAVLLILGLSPGPLIQAAPIRQGTSADASCEVVSIGQWYCTIDGKGYYCDTNNNPDKNKNCRPARLAPTGPKGNLNQGMLRNQQILRRGLEGDSPKVESEAGNEKGDEVKERAVRRPDPRPKPPIPPKGPTDPPMPPVGPGGTGPTIPK